MPAGQESDDLTSHGCIPTCALPPVILFLTSNRVLLEKARASCQLSLTCVSLLAQSVAASHGTPRSSPHASGPHPREACRPGPLWVSTHSHTQLTHTAPSPLTTGSGRAGSRGCHAAPSLLSLALPQPCCWWGSRAGSPSDSEFLWHMMCLPCPSP